MKVRSSRMRAIAERLAQELKRNGCHICSEEERDLIEKTLFPDGKFDTSVVGKSAEIIAEKAGIRVPARTRVHRRAARTHRR